MKDQRPNLLFIMTDQQCADAMSCAGNLNLNTPAMDWIASQGIRFERAYCATPLCVPARASLFSGKMPHEIDVPYNIHLEHQQEFMVPLMGTYFKEADYDTGYVGKWHLPVNAGSAFHGFDYLQHAEANGIDPHVAKASCKFMQQERERPFLLVSSFVNPHDICEWARGDRLPNGEIPEPASLEECPALPANHAVPELEPSCLEKVLSSSGRQYPTKGWSEEQWRRYRFAYYRLVEKVDAQIGEVLEGLKNSCLLENTVIIFTSDHGDGMGAHRWNQKQVLYEEVARVPLIMARPGHNEGKSSTKALANACLDIMPTMMDYAGVEVPASWHGRSLKPWVENQSPADWRDYVACETEFCNKFEDSTGVTGRMIRTADYKYMIYSEGEHREMLVDMVTDPGETCNIAAHSEMAGVLCQHRSYLQQWIKQSQDDFDPGW